MSNIPLALRRRDKLEKNDQKPNVLVRTSRRLFHRKTPQTLNAGTASSGSSVCLSAAASNTEILCSESANPGTRQAEASNTADLITIASSPESSDRLPSQATALPSSSTTNSNPPTPSTLPSIEYPPPVSLGLNQDTSSSNTDPAHLIPSSQPATPRANKVAPRQLWSEALDKLSDEDQQAIHGLQPKTGTQEPLSKTSINKLLGLTRDVQKKYQESAFKFSFKGRDIILRDVAGKIIFWLSKFKEIGDIAVNFDPVHASLPWTGVGFLLQAAISEHEQMGVLVVAVEKLAYLINRGAIYERLYQPGTIPADILSNLHDAIVKMYATILQLMASCHRLFVKNFATRALHAIFNSDVDALLQKCEEVQRQVESEAHICQSTHSQKAGAETERLLKILQEPILRTDERVFNLLEKIEEKERLEILDWISKVLYGSNHQTVNDKRTADTCEWLLEHRRYYEWQEPSASIILWLCGNAGTGKTFLTSKVINEIQVALENNPNQEGFAFFYCNRNEAERREPLSVLRAFVRQLSTIASGKQSMQKSLKKFVLDTRLKASQPTVQDCKELLLEFINVYPRTTLILDALDECERHNRLELTEVFDELLAQASNPLKIFISSRPDLDIKRKLKDHANIEIEARDNHDDITRFVSSQISKHSGLHTMDSKLQSQIVTTLQDRSQGMFQWAFLQIKQLLDLDLEEDILDRLGKLPDDLKQAYDEIYHAMSDAEKRIADRAFQWVMCAYEPLKTKELLAAISQDADSDILKPLIRGLDEDLVLKYCHNLLIIDPVRKVWVPSHLSVIEYFENSLWSQSQAHFLVSRVCLSLLQNTVLYNREKSWEMEGYSISIAQDSLTEDPLYGQGFEYLSYYARYHWPAHAQNCAAMWNKNLISNRLEEFLGLPTESSTAYQCWHRMVSTERSPRTSTLFKQILPLDITPAYIASFAYCAFGFTILLPNWDDFKWVTVENKTETGRTFLELAVISGSVPTCRYLVEHGVKVNAQTKSNNGSALAAAAWKKER